MKIVVDNVPRCDVPGCEKKAGNLTGGKNPKYRKSRWVREEYDAENGWVCTSCHNKKIAKNRGVSSILEVLAENAGYDSVREYVNSKHPYLQWRKSYCENVDGRLGFTCTYTPPSEEQLSLMDNVDPSFMGWLHVDHIDANSDNNEVSNLQTLCACCHTVKTAMNKDYESPGRKTLKKMRESKYNCSS